jgi:hypothetical protein
MNRSQQSRRAQQERVFDKASSAIMELRKESDNDHILREAIMGNHVDSLKAFSGCEVERAIILKLIIELIDLIPDK